MKASCCIAAFAGLLYLLVPKGQEKGTKVSALRRLLGQKVNDISKATKPQSSAGAVAKASVRNFWRFPYLTYIFQRGIFVAPYALILLFAGAPLKITRPTPSALTQIGLSPYQRWQRVGYSASLVTVYYITILAWAIHYLGRTRVAAPRSLRSLRSLTWSDEAQVDLLRHPPTRQVSTEVSGDDICETEDLKEIKRLKAKNQDLMWMVNVLRARSFWAGFHVEICGRLL